MSCLVDILLKTRSDRSELLHSPQFGTPFFWYTAIGRVSGPLTDDEQDKIVNAKKKDPATADEIFPNLLIGNKGAAEDSQFLAKKSITHVINLAAASSSKFIVTPDRCALQTKKIRLTQVKILPTFLIMWEI